MPEGGSVHITTSGVVLTSGKPIRLYGLQFASSVSGAGTVTIYDGTGTSGTQRDQLTGNPNGNTEITYGSGIRCNGGLYVNLDANVTYCDLNVLQEAST